ncbi:hypothetical protein HDV05_007023 [Chytridiales sp. JEL 0842]|nr:hypothetical protein HDV05_007023 [Chytridiales sp. JEL 0842]
MKLKITDDLIQVRIKSIKNKLKRSLDSIGIPDGLKAIIMGDFLTVIHPNSKFTMTINNIDAVLCLKAVTPNLWKACVASFEKTGNCPQSYYVGRRFVAAQLSAVQKWKVRLASTETRQYTDLTFIRKAFSEYFQRYINYRSTLHFAIKNTWRDLLKEVRFTNTVLVFAEIFPALIDNTAMQRWNMRERFIADLAYAIESQPEFEEVVAKSPKGNADDLIRFYSERISHICHYNKDPLHGSIEGVAKLIILKELDRASKSAHHRESTLRILLQQNGVTLRVGDSDLTAAYIAGNSSRDIEHVAALYMVSSALFSHSHAAWSYMRETYESQLERMAMKGLNGEDGKPEWIEAAKTIINSKWFANACAITDEVVTTRVKSIDDKLKRPLASIGIPDSLKTIIMGDFLTLLHPSTKITMVINDLDAILLLKTVAPNLWNASVSALEKTGKLPQSLLCTKRFVSSQLTAVQRREVRAASTGAKALKNSTAIRKSLAAYFERYNQYLHTLHFAIKNAWRDLLEPLRFNIVVLVFAKIFPSFIDYTAAQRWNSKDRLSAELAHCIELQPEYAALVAQSPKVNADDLVRFYGERVTQIRNFEEHPLHGSNVGIAKFIISKELDRLSKPKEERETELKALLEQNGLKLRSDSRLAASYIAGTSCKDVEQVVAILKVTAELFKYSHIAWSQLRGTYESLLEQQALKGAYDAEGKPAWIETANSITSTQSFANACSSARSYRRYHDYYDDDDRYYDAEEDYYYM